MATPSCAAPALMAGMCRSGGPAGREPTMIEPDRVCRPLLVERQRRPATIAGAPDDWSVTGGLERPAAVARSRGLDLRGFAACSPEHHDLRIGGLRSGRKRHAWRELPPSRASPADVLTWTGDPNVCPASRLIATKTSVLPAVDAPHATATKDPAAATHGVVFERPVTVEGCDVGRVALRAAPDTTVANAASELRQPFDDENSYA